jgi:predicted nucleotidyltransferase
MSDVSEIDLTTPQRETLRAVLSDFADRIDIVGVYGSRVQGNARPGSDVDLVIFGRLDLRDEAAIRSALEESDLSVFADVVAYDLIEHQPLKAQIDHWMRTLFTRADLLAAQAERAA